MIPRTIGKLWPVTVFLLATSLDCRADYFDDAFEKLDEAQLLKKTSSFNVLERAQGHFFLAERRELEGRPGAAGRELAQAMTICETLTDPFCDLVRLKDVEQLPSYIRFFKSAPGVESPSELNDKLYLEARSHLVKTPGFGLDTKRALIDLEALKRLTANRSSLQYWTARAQLIQVNPKYKENLKEAYEKKDVRTLLSYSPERGVNRLLLDGMGSKWGLGLAANPRLGAGLLLRYDENRWFDSDREVSGFLLAGTRSAVQGGLFYEDRELLKDFGIGGSVEGFILEEKDVVQGPDSVISSLLTDGRYVSPRFFVKRYFLNHFHLGIGWRWVKHAQPEDVSFNGGTGELIFDSRNSRYAAWEGSFMGIRGFFPRVYESIEGFGEHNVPIIRGSSIRVRYFGASIQGAVPYFDLRENSFSLWMPGQRQGRFRDFAAMGLASELRYRLGSLVTVGVFGSLGTVGSTFGALFGQAPKPGGGVGFEFAFSNFLRDRTRVEVAVYERDWLFQMGLNILPGGTLG